MMTSVLLLIASVFVAPDFANVFPPSIRTIGVVMPASILDKSVLDSGINALRKAGYQVKIAKRISFDRKASVEDRVADFEEVWLDPDVDVMFCARGGVGCEDVVSRLDWTKLSKRPEQRLVGFSNVTVLLNAMEEHGIGHPFSGPNFGSICTCEGDTLDWLARALEGRPLPETKLRALRPGAFSGRPCGGHIGLVRKCAESGWMPDATGRVVFLERNDSMTVAGIGRELDAIFASGYLERAAGVIFGDVKPGKKDSGESWADAEHFRDAAELQVALKELEAVKRSFAAKLSCPVYEGFVYGHIPVMHTIDFRRTVGVTADGVMSWK